MEIMFERCDSCRRAYLASENEIVHLFVSERSRKYKPIFDLCSACLGKIMNRVNDEDAPMFVVEHNDQE